MNEPAALGIAVAFAAGLLSFLSPCVLPLVPSYVGFLTGMSLGELEGRRRVALLHALLFVAGFSLVFILLGASATALGRALNYYQVWLQRIGGVLIIAFGLVCLGLFKPAWLVQERRFHLEQKPVGFLGSALVGMAFGAGWTPCIGPVLGAILGLAATSADLSRGMLLLGVYSAGLAVPFLLAAVEAETPKLIQPLSEPFFRIEELPRGRWVATLPSPYSLAEQAVGEIEPRTVAETILGPQIRWLADNGCAYLVLQETALFSSPSGASDSYRLSEALDALAGSLPIALQLPFGDAGNILGELMELDVDAIGVDFYATDASSLPRPFPKTLLAGVIDARNSLLEEAEAVADFGRSLLEDMDEGTQLHLVPNGDLQFVPQKIAREKVLRLGAAARILKDAATEEGAVT